MVLARNLKRRTQPYHRTKILEKRGKNNEKGSKYASRSQYDFTFRL